MERVAFLIERTGERVACMLNPESLVSRRSAGIAKRGITGGPLQGSTMSDDPLLYTGGGVTELTLDLLFDTTLAEGSSNVEDVRELTRPLWNLTENQGTAAEAAHPESVRFVWGKAWNIQGVITSVAERLEFFTQEGLPRRSWLRMRLCRVNMTADQRGENTQPAGVEELVTPDEVLEAEPREGQETIIGTHPAEDSETTVTRIEELAARVYGDPAMWRAIAWFNEIEDPLHIPPGTVLSLPDIRTARQ
jgi:hypothetical protein